jgi:uncharacterized protein
LLFFYLGFFIPILKVQFEFPYVIYQGVTMYLLLAIGWHEASPTLPLAASLGLTFSYNVTIGIPVYIEISRAVTQWFPIT